MLLRLVPRIKRSSSSSESGEIFRADAMAEAARPIMHVGGLSLEETTAGLVT